MLLFFCSCSQQTNTYRAEDSNTTCLLNYILFENHAAFVLFGSKPVASILLSSKTDRQDDLTLLASLPESLRKTAKIVEHPIDFQKTWKIWKKKQKTLSFPSFCILEEPLAQHPSTLVLKFVHIERTLALIEEHKSLFESVVGKKFDPKIEIENLRKGGSDFWTCVFTDPVTQGLLYGYGKNNAQCFSKMLKGELPSEELLHSVRNQVVCFQASPQNFTIPIFRTTPQDEVAKKYTLEKKQIEAVFHRKKVVKVAEERLRKKA